MEALHEPTDLICMDHAVALGAFSYVVGPGRCLYCSRVNPHGAPDVPPALLLTCVVACCVVQMAVQLPDVQTGFEIREEMYEHMNTTMPTMPPRRVLLYLRQGLENRRVYKVDMLIDIMKKLNVNYT